MKKSLQILFFILITSVSINQAKAQFTFADVKYWIGTGNDTSLLVVDFHDGSFWDTCYAWGYLHDGTATGADMLNAVTATDINFSVSVSGGFLNDIVYGTHAGIGGTGGFYWSTWSGTGIANMAMNAGISTPLANGDWFACSFTDFNPPVAPGEPIPAFEPHPFTPRDVAFWTGTGSDTTLLVIDFRSNITPSSFAWGYLHSGNTTGEQMLLDIAANDPKLTVAIAGGFLNDITYDTHAGIGGTGGLYWSTWSGTNFGNWDMNLGLSTPLGNKDLFGCSFTDFAPALRPFYPTAATNTSGIGNHENQASLSVYPNPARDYIHLNMSKMTDNQTSVTIVDLTGKIVYTENLSSRNIQIPVHQLPDGIYSIFVQGDNLRYCEYFIKQ